MKVIYLLCALLLIVSIKCQPRDYNSYCTSSQPTWLTSNYFRAGNANVISTLTGNTVTPTYTFIFSSPMTNTPRLAYGIKNYRGADYMGQEYFQIWRVSLDNTQFTVSVQILGITNIYIMNVPYIAVDPSFRHLINTFDNVPLNVSQGPMNNVSIQVAAYTYHENTIDYSVQASGLTYNSFSTPFSKHKISLFITSLFINAAFASGGNMFPIHLNVTTNIIDSTHYTIRVSISNMVKVTKLHFSMIFFDNQDIINSGVYAINNQKWITPNLGGFKKIPIEFVDNFIMGVSQFKTVDGRCGFEYNWEYKTIGGVYGVAVNESIQVSGTCGFSETTSTIFYLKTWVCPAVYTYFDVIKDLCVVCQPCNNTGLAVDLDTQLCDVCTIPNCVQCLSTEQCQTCDSSINYVVDPLTGGCKGCTLKGCSICISETQCASCDTFNSYKLDTNGLCVICKVKTSKGILASYFVKQSSDANKATIILTLDDPQQMIDFGSYPVYSVSSNISITWGDSWSDGTNVYLEGLFNEDFIDVIAELKVIIGTRPDCLMTFYFTIQFSVSMSTALIAYTESQFVMQKQAESATKAAVAISYGVGIFALTSGKIVGIQLFGVIQLAFFTLAHQNEVNILLRPLLQMQSVNGLNIQGDGESSKPETVPKTSSNLHRMLQDTPAAAKNLASETAQLPNRVRELKYSSMFLSNFNIMFALTLAILFAGIVIYCIASRTAICSTKTQKIAKHMLKEVLLTAVLFNSLNVAFSTGVHFAYADHTNPRYWFESLLAALSLGGVLAMGVYSVFAKDEGFGEYKKKFKSDVGGKLYFFMTISYRVGLGFYIALANESSTATLLILFFSLTFVLFNLVNLPFTSPIHNYRANICHLTQLGTLLITNYYRSMQSETPETIRARIMTPAIIEIILIYSCIIISAAVAVYELYQFMKTIKGKVFGSSSQNESVDKIEYSSSKEGESNIFNAPHQQGFEDKSHHQQQVEA